MRMPSGAASEKVQGCHDDGDAASNFEEMSVGNVQKIGPVWNARDCVRICDESGCEDESAEGKCGIAGERRRFHASWRTFGRASFPA
mmetsp:Transcript_18233/g.69127  ORF Transcript_18233/g.69127 Transcript_18233/m.69127 type:complete len:87 (-) Transcript_18233:1637-1897(-)|eukprot:scaffold730_cov365-Pinguiococcus_pyrenoidosus.AAC.4